MRVEPKIVIVAGPLDAQTGKLRRAIPSVCGVLLAQLRLRFQRARLYGLSREIGSFYHRIRIRWNSTLDREGLQMDRDLHTTREGSQRVCTDTRARMKDTLEVLEAAPWLTVLDADLFSAGWKLGTEWMRRNYDRQCSYCCVASLTPRIRILGCEKEFGNVPNVVSNSGLHGGSDAQSLVNAAEVVPSKIERHGGL